MSNVKSTAKKPNAMSGLEMVGGAAAGAAAGSFVGPIGAAVGAVVGGLAGANAAEIAESASVKRIATATKKTIANAMTTKAVRKVLKKIPITRAQSGPSSGRSAASKKNVKSKKRS